MGEKFNFKFFTWLSKVDKRFQNAFAAAAVAHARSFRRMCMAGNAFSKPNKRTQIKTAMHESHEYNMVGIGFISITPISVDGGWVHIRVREDSRNLIEFFPLPKIASLYLGRSMISKISQIVGLIWKIHIHQISTFIHTYGIWITIQNGSFIHVSESI